MLGYTTVYCTTACGGGLSTHECSAFASAAPGIRARLVCLHANLPHPGSNLRRPILDVWDSNACLVGKLLGGQEPNSPKCTCYSLFVLNYNLFHYEKLDILKK